MIRGTCLPALVNPIPLLRITPDHTLDRPGVKTGDRQDLVGFRTCKSRDIQGWLRDDRIAALRLIANEKDRPYQGVGKDSQLSRPLVDRRCLVQEWKKKGLSAAAVVIHKEGAEPIVLQVSMQSTASLFVMDDFDTLTSPQSCLEIHHRLIFLVLDNDLGFSGTLMEAQNSSQELPCPQMGRDGDDRPVFLPNLPEEIRVYEVHPFMEKAVIKLSAGEDFHIRAPDMAEIFSGQGPGFPGCKAQMKGDGLLSELAASWQADPQDLAQESPHELQLRQAQALEPGRQAFVEWLFEHSIVCGARGSAWPTRFQSCRNHPGY